MVKPPPWIHTMTGRAGPLAAGAQTLSVRQSSDTGSLLWVGSQPPRFWTQSGPNAAASRTPFHPRGACGGRQRNGPTGGAPQGRPLNTPPPTSLPPPASPLPTPQTGAPPP